VLADYSLTQHRLIPIFANLFAIALGNMDLFFYWNDNPDKIFEEGNIKLAEIHAISSVLKPYASWVAQKGIQECRELCGGLGYSAYNRLGSLREDNDVNATWEGDNNVLLQQTGKFILDNLKKLKSGKKSPFPSTQYLTPKFNTKDYESQVNSDS